MATIKNAGRSRSNTIMYNPNKTAGTDIFACYADTTHYTLPVIHKLHGQNATDIDNIGEEKHQLHIMPIMHEVNLLGQKVDEGYRGIIVENGKKWLKK